MMGRFETVKEALRGARIPYWLAFFTGLTSFPFLVWKKTSW